MARQHRTTIRIAILGLAALALTACETWQTPDEYVGDLFRHGRWQQAKLVQDNSVERIAIEHVVAFASTSADMTRAERLRLAEFLRRANVGKDDQVTLYGPLRDHGRHDPVTTARIQFVRGELLVKGISATAPLVQRNGQELRDGISVVVSRNVVITPDCSQPQPAPGHRPRFVVGCSNTANIGNMIVDPLDLEHGKTPDPADGETAAQSIKRLRDRKTEKLRSIDAETTN
ncbi:MAG: CpaD family pilus assembly lipoprotein [Kiloniellales bacterium]